MSNSRKIRLLDPRVISKIAAGEVIERPASAVKELIENSIDAQATNISVEILNGGKDLIVVRDNGIGMTKEDCIISIKRHSTSKIISDKDLEKISTLGFRGEALYSIASVSRFSIKTRTNTSEMGVLLTVEGDIDKFKLSEIPIGQPGTTITVRDLFFNFPVRRKFLKSDISERNQIKKIVIRYAISYPNIAFELTSNGKSELKTYSSNSPLESIKSIYGTDFSNRLIDIGIFQKGEVQIHGFVSKHNHHYHNRNYQNIFLNNRWISAPKLAQAVVVGYGSYIMKGEYPIFFLFIDLPPDKYDVNIHPSKREVLFHDEDELFAVIKECISRIVGNKQKTISHSLLGFISEKKFVEPSTKEVSAFNKIKAKSTGLNTSVKSFKIVQPKIQKEFSLSNVYQVVDTINPKEKLVSLFNTEIRIIGQLGNHFILLEDIRTNDIIVLDFHAAEERINLEYLEDKLLSSGLKESYNLLHPLIIDIDNIERNDNFFKKLKFLNQLGIDIRLPKGKLLLEIHSFPKILEKKDISVMVNKLLQDDNSEIIINEIGDVLAEFACHYSKRAGTHYSFFEISKLLERLSKTRKPDICAHGRPTNIRIEYKSLLQGVRRM